MNGHAHCFRARLARFHFSPIFNSIILVICLSTAAHAQDLDDVSFAGVVSDEHGAVVPGASVTARLVNAGAERTATTDGEGRYRLVELQPGAYTLRAVSAGFAAEERREVFTLAGQSVRVDFTLRPAALAAEQTTVSDREAPLIDTTRTVAGGSVTREEFERLPSFSRSPLDSVFLLGGVTEEPAPPASANVPASSGASAARRACPATSRSSAASRVESGSSVTPPSRKTKSSGEREEERQPLQLLARDRAARDGARRVDDGRGSVAHDRLFGGDGSRSENEVEPHGLSGEREEFPPLLRGEARTFGSQRVGAGLEFNQTVTPFSVGHGRALGSRVDEPRRDPRAGDDGAVLVGDDAREGDLVEVLRAGGRRETDDENDVDENQVEVETSKSDAEGAGVAVHLFFSRRRPERHGGGV